ncbi:DUF2155 domain-containing protein [Thermovibrio sp.]
MRKRELALALLIAISGTALTACGKSSETTQTSQQESKEVKPEPLTALNSQKDTRLPEGHPPINNLPKGHPPVGNMMGNLPPGHPMVGNNKEIMAMHSSKNLTKFDRPIRIPEEVQKTWKFATIDIVDKTTGKVAKEIKVKSGETVNFGGLEIKVLYVVPHLVLDNGYTSASNEPQNPAILVIVKENGKTIYAGPIYQKFPHMYNINHPRYELILKGISKG